MAAGLASFFTLLGGIVILLGKPPQQWVRFVAVQSIVMCVAYFILIIAITIVSTMLAIAHLGILSLLLWVVEMVSGLAYFIAWIIQTIQAFQGKAQRLPARLGLDRPLVPMSTHDRLESDAREQRALGEAAQLRVSDFAPHRRHAAVRRQLRSARPADTAGRVRSSRDVVGRLDACRVATSMTPTATVLSPASASTSGGTCEPASSIEIWSVHERASSGSTCAYWSHRSPRFAFHCTLAGIP